MKTKFTLQELKMLPTLSQSQFDNLKVEIKNKARVWLSRMTIADGMPYNNQVTIERLINGNWKTVTEYQAK